VRERKLLLYEYIIARINEKQIRREYTQLKNQKKWLSNYKTKSRIDTKSFIQNNKKKIN